MCSTSYCPCVKVNMTKWPLSQQVQMKRLNFQGAYSEFQKCYGRLVAKGQIPEIDKGLLGVIRALENKANCSGLCKKPLFWFSKDISL